MGFTFSQSADAASINCPASAGSYALEDQIEYNDKLSCRYGSGGYFWLQWDFFVDENFACTGKEHTTLVFTYISSKTHLAHVHYELYYEKNVKQAAIQLLHDFESKNIATSCSGQNNAEDKQFQNNCPTGYPYLRSDGLCYQCPTDFPFLHSDNLCYDGPECTGNFPYLHSDNKCWNKPECTDPKYPYPHSDGLCHTVVECTDPDFPYPRSDGKCWDRPEEQINDDPPVKLEVPTPPGWTNVIPDNSNTNVNCLDTVPSGGNTYLCNTKFDGHAKFYYPHGSYVIGPASQVSVHPPAPFIGMPGDLIQRLDVEQELYNWNLTVPMKSTALNVC